MSIGKNGTHDILLESDDTASPTTAVELLLAKDEQGRRRWKEVRRPPYSPRQSQGAVSYAHFDPDRDLVWSQKSWHGGALAQVYRADGSTENRYLQADGVDMRWEGVAALGMQKSKLLGHVIRNPGFEGNNVNGWTASTGTMTAITTAPRTGTYHAYLVGAANGAGADYYYDVPNPSQYSGRTVTFGAYIRSVVGSAGCRIQLSDTTGGTVSSTVTSTSYTWVSVTVTINASNALLRLFLVARGSGGGTADSMYADDLVFLASSNDTSAGLAEANGKLYTAVGPIVQRWDETDDYWESVYVQTSGASATDIISYNDRIYVAYGYGTSYCYGIGDDEVKATRTTYAFVDGGAGDDSITDSSNNFLADGFKVGDSITITGSASNNYTTTIKTVTAGTITLPTGTTTAENAGPSETIEVGWVASTRTAPDDKARYFATRRAQLWKSESANTVASTTDASNAAGAAAWSDAYTVGSSSTNITKLYSFNDSVVVGKEDGFHLFTLLADGGGTSTFTYGFNNVTNQFRSFPDADNFARGHEWYGRLYMIAAQQSLFYYDGDSLVNISSLLFSPRSGHTGRVRAITGDPSNLFMLIDVNTADTSSSKETWLYSLREASGVWYVHTLEKVEIGDINALAVHGGYLYALGRLYHDGIGGYFMSSYRWTLPTKSIAPAFDATPAINTQASVDTFVWDAGLPDEDKAFIALTLFLKGSVMDAQHTVVVDFGVDGAASTGTNLGTFSGTGNIQTKFFDGITTPESSAIGKAIQLNFEINTDDTVSPELYAFALHATLRPDRVRTWELILQVGEGTMQYTGLPDPESKATKLSALSTLEQQVYPIRMTADLDNDGNNEHSDTAVQIIPGTLERVPDEEKQEGVELWRLILQEVTVA